VFAKADGFLKTTRGKKIQGNTSTIFVSILLFLVLYLEKQCELSGGRSGREAFQQISSKAIPIKTDPGHST
jgi:hypothetical protein